MDSAGDSSHPFKVVHSATPLRVRTNVEDRRRRRSSLASLAILKDELEGPGDQRSSRSGKTVRDRFIAGSSSSPVPLTATPRSRRLAKAIGMYSHDRRLNFHSEENLNPATQMSSVVPFKKDLNKLTRSLYEVPVVPSATSAATNLNRLAEMCLGAPDLVDDFYSRLASWSKEDLLAVAMDNAIVYRNMNTNIISRVAAIDRLESVTCVGWNPRQGTSSHLAVGCDTGVLSVYDVETKQRYRTIDPTPRGDAVGAFSWKDANVITIGYFSGMLRQFDVRENRKGKGYRAHRSRACGVEWNPNSTLLATGAGDASVALWDCRSNKREALSIVHTAREVTPLTVDSDALSSSSTSSPQQDAYLNDLRCTMRSKRHISTVKALAWCPWQPELLASGGGTKDGTIKFWDARLAKVKKLSIPTSSQVSSLHFAPTCREIVSTHGYAFAPSVNLDETTPGPALPAPRKHSILVHNYPKGELVGKIYDPVHGRITHSQLSPDGTRLMTCGSDRSIRIYRLFGQQRQLPKERDGFSRSIIR